MIGIFTIRVDASRCDCGSLQTVGKEEPIDDGQKTQTFREGDRLFLKEEEALREEQQQAEQGGSKLVSIVDCLPDMNL